MMPLVCCMIKQRLWFMWPSHLNPPTKCAAEILSIGILEVNLILSYQSLPASTCLACYFWWFGHDNLIGFLFFGVNTVATLNGAELARGWYELRDILFSFNLAPLQASRTLRKLIYDRNNELYGKGIWPGEINSMDFLSLNLDAVSELKDSAPVCDWCELQGLIVRFNLAPIWDPRTLRNLRIERSNEMCGKWDDLDI